MERIRHKQKVERIRGPGKPINTGGIPLSLVPTIEKSFGEMFDIDNPEDYPTNLPISFIPTFMTRTHPFYPARRYQPELYSEPQVMEDNWGIVTIVGWKLSGYDKDVMLALLRLYREKKSPVFLTTYYQICKTLGIFPSKKTYTAIKESLWRLSSTKFRVDVKKEGRITHWYAFSILGSLAGDEETGKLLIQLDPIFKNLYAQKLITNINLEFRRQLKGDVAKFLYDYLEGDRDFYKRGFKQIGLLKLCKLLNMDTVDTKPYVLRKQIRKVLSDMAQNGYLKEWHITKKDVVVVVKGDAHFLWVDPTR